MNKEPGATDKFKEISAAYEVCMPSLSLSSYFIFIFIFIRFACLLFTELHYCQVLSDDQKRALYDQYGEAGLKTSVGGGPSATYTVTFSLLNLGTFTAFAHALSLIVCLKPALRLGISPSSCI